MSIFEKEFVENHEKTCSALTNLAEAYKNLGKYGKQRHLLIKSLNISEIFFGKDHQQTGLILTNLGMAYKNLGDYDKRKIF